MTKRVNKAVRLWLKEEQSETVSPFVLFMEDYFQTKWISYKQKNNISGWVHVDSCDEELIQLTLRDGMTEPDFLRFLGWVSPYLQVENISDEDDNVIYIFNVTSKVSS